MNTNWTKEDLKIYLLIYCANADFSESKQELNYIKEKIHNSNLDKIRDEFEKDNEYQSIQKIQSAIKDLEYSKLAINSLFEEIKELFKSDDNFDTQEHNLFRGLNKILK
tara:strand:+ start:13104 stop:13430 length:327 start_codon:yes stop_codon:yes gene_type:complete